MNADATTALAETPAVLNQTSALDVLDAKALAELGLEDSDLADVLRVASELNSRDRKATAGFGGNVTASTEAAVDDLMANSVSTELEDAGKKLNAVVVLARNITQRSQLPLIGGLVDAVRMRKNSVVARFETVREQMDSLISQVEAVQDGIATRNDRMDEMLGTVAAEERSLAIHVAAGKLKLAEFRREAAELRAKATSTSDFEQLAQIDQNAASLDIRLGSLIALRESARLTMPQIRLMQFNAGVQHEKFTTIKTVTFPTWKRHFLMRLNLAAQRDAVALANAVDDTTNYLLRSGAKELHRNSVETAKANQRLVIDPETLVEVQNTFIQTIQDVLAIRAEGARAREAAERQFAGLRNVIQTRLAGADKVVTQAPARLH